MFKKGDESERKTSLYGQIDERTKAVVYQGDAYTARFMQFAILIDVFIRGMKILEPITASNWDLLLIVLAGGFISTAFQIKRRVLFSEPRLRSLMYVLMIIAISAIAAFIMIMLK